MLSRTIKTLETKLPVAAFSNRAFADYTVFGDKAMFSLGPVPPTFTASETYIALKYPGKIRISMAPKAPGDDTKFEWNNKHYILLNHYEIAGFMEGRSGKVTKTSTPRDSAVQRQTELEWTFHKDRSCSVQMKVIDGGVQKMFSQGTLGTPDTMILTRLVQGSLPYLFGFHQVFQTPQLMQDDASVNDYSQ